MTPTNLRNEPNSPVSDRSADCSHQSDDDKPRCAGAKLRALKIKVRSCGRDRVRSNCPMTSRRDAISREVGDQQVAENSAIIQRDAARSRICFGRIVNHRQKFLGALPLTVLKAGLSSPIGFVRRSSESVRFPAPLQSASSSPSAACYLRP